MVDGKSIRLSKIECQVDKPLSEKVGFRHQNTEKDCMISLILQGIAEHVENLTETFNQDKPKKLNLTVLK
jgi:hypothetical protein